MIYIAPISYKCSAVADMGYRLVTIDIGRKLGAVSLWRGAGELGPHETQRGLGRGLPSHQVASWSIQPFGHNRQGPKIGGCAPFLGERAGSPSRTMWPCRQDATWYGGRPRKAYVHTKWHLDPSSCLATIDMGLWAVPPFCGGGAGSPSSTMWPGTRPTGVLSFILIRPTVWPQYTNVTDRTDRQTGPDNGPIA